MSFEGGGVLAGGRLNAGERGRLMWRGEFGHYDLFLQGRFFMTTFFGISGVCFTTATIHDRIVREAISEV